MKKISFVILAAIFCFTIDGNAQKTEKLYLSGTDKDHTVEWKFRVDGGRKSGQWATIPVPSQWELHGFGSYAYGRDKPFKSRPDERGFYQYRFSVPESWENKSVNIVFEGVMTDTKVTINGQSAGRVHRGGFYEFKYDISGLLNYGAQNVLEAVVSKRSSNETVNRAERYADYWIFGGIFRPVYLEAKPSRHIKRVAIDAKANGTFSVNIFTESEGNAASVIGQITTLDGQKVGSEFKAKFNREEAAQHISTKLRGVDPWSPEFPNLYNVEFYLEDGSGKVIHQTEERFGFRTVELKEGDGFYVNGKKIRFKGVDYHDFYPGSGRTTSKALNIQDVNLMKNMNMNAVRMSHYPHDKDFYDVADSLGLFVIDELAGWQDAYDTKIGQKLVKETVIRDVNHPSIVLWANGNEGGNNFDLDDDFRKYDPQNRTVIHPWANFGGMDTDHYESYESTKRKLSNDTLFVPTEFLHGLYDGGHGAGLQDYWRVIRDSPMGTGGFLWAFADEGIERTDQSNRVDVSGNEAPDGIVGPYRRQKEGSYYTIKEVWSPVEINAPKLTGEFDKSLEIRNRYFYTNLKQCRFEWQLVDFPSPSANLSGYTVAEGGSIEAPDVAPQQKGRLDLPLPDGWQSREALFVKAIDPHGREINKWTWMVRTPNQVRQKIVAHTGQEAKGEENSQEIILSGGESTVSINKSNGQISIVKHKGKPVSFKNGPRFIADSSQVSSITSYAEGSNYVAEINYKDKKKQLKYTMNGQGWLKIDYSYIPREGSHPYLGITFDYPPQNVLKSKWLGQGPYRVWKNRMQGVNFNVWSNRKNDTKTGQEWNYPEFKGYFSNLYWAQLETTEQPITMISDSQNLFFRLLTPSYGINPKNTNAAFPEGDISFLNAIAPIGTKFHTPEELGPQGQPTKVDEDNRPMSGSLYFYFGEIQK